MSNVKALFVHIPKTAGISLYKSIDHPKIKIKGHFIQNPFHLFLKNYLRLHPKDQFKIFSFVRNPWDRLVSAFFYLEKGGRNLCDILDQKRYLSKFNGDFESFVKEGIIEGKVMKQLHLIPQYKWICDDDDTILADYIGYFESLNDDLKKISKELSIPFKALEHKNNSSHKPYYTLYDQEMIDIVAKAYEKDIKLFNYSFK
ncbi:MAG: sulfotransferase family 2 domain-containing protein [Candidatus Neomarinimicrobiota bacterium]|jgi:hypothetical protein